MKQPGQIPGRWLFPLAALHALVMAPLWLILFGQGLAGPAWHAHEMLFGYALAVIAGFLVTRRGRPVILPLVAGWLLARIGMLLPGLAGAPLLGMAFPLMLLWFAAPPLWRGAKRAENRIVPAVLLLLALLDAGWWWGQLTMQPVWQHRVLLAALDMVTLMMLIIGGRMLPAAVGGFLERQGIPRRDHIRRGYELPLAALAVAMLACDLSGLATAAGLFALLLALLTLLRVSRWQLHYSFARADLWPVALGYVWLIPGLLLKGAAQSFQWLPLPQALHALSMGALGTLTLVMMARTALLRARRSLTDFRDIIAAALLIGFATLLRLFAGSADTALLWTVAGLWGLAFGILLVRLLRPEGPGVTQKRPDS